MTYNFDVMFQRASVLTEGKRIVLVKILTKTMGQQVSKTESKQQLVYRVMEHEFGRDAMTQFLNVQDEISAPSNP